MVNMTQLLIFDLDGTLFDTAPGILSAVNGLLEDYSVAPVDMKQLVTYIGTGAMGLVMEVQRASGLQLGTAEKLEAQFLQHYDKYYLSGSQLYPGVVDFLRSWSGRLAILSNKKERYIRSMIENSDLSSFHWECIVGGDTFASRKPDPEGLNHLLKTMGVSISQSLLIGDGLPDIQLCQLTGLKSIAVSFGYAPIANLLANGADSHIDHYNELDSQIRNFP
jgi:phosphoglycolate phosphatase